MFIRLVAEFSKPFCKCEKMTDPMWRLARESRDLSLECPRCHTKLSIPYTELRMGMAYVDPEPKPDPIYPFGRPKDGGTN